MCTPAVNILKRIPRCMHFNNVNFTHTQSQNRERIPPRGQTSIWGTTAAVCGFGPTARITERWKPPDIAAADTMAVHISAQSSTHPSRECYRTNRFKQNTRARIHTQCALTRHPQKHGQHTQAKLRVHTPMLSLARRSGDCEPHRTADIITR